jgi:hypothetical protein
LSKLSRRCTWGQETFSGLWVMTRRFVCAITNWIDRKWFITNPFSWDFTNFIHHKSPVESDKLDVIMLLVNVLKRTYVLVVLWLSIHLTNLKLILNDTREKSWLNFFYVIETKRLFYELHSKKGLTLISCW